MDKLIERLYVEKADKDVELLCSHTTRRDGFLDVLLSGNVLCSDEAEKVMGCVGTHRGGIYGKNRDISFSTGFVSYKYSGHDVWNRKDYVGGLGIFVPLESMLKFPNLSFSHCSFKGDVEESDLNKVNMTGLVHKVRKDGELYDDGYGNVFEIGMNSVLEDSDNPRSKVVSYPRLKLGEDVVVAIPNNERGRIENDLVQRQRCYKEFLDKVSGLDVEESRWSEVDGRSLFYLDMMVPFMEKMVEPFDIEELPVVWYGDRNLDGILKRISVGK